jgi:hypothetical protein
MLLRMADEFYDALHSISRACVTSKTTASPQLISSLLLLLLLLCGCTADDGLPAQQQAQVIC